MTTYSRSVDDLALLHNYRHNDFLKKEYYAFRVIKKTAEESRTVYTCHICATDVPAAFASEHAASVKHRANTRIASVAMQRTRGLISALAIPLPAPPNGRFCANCSTMAGKHHDLTKEHHMAVMHDEQLWKLMKIYVNGKSNDGNEVNDDKRETQKGEGFKNNVTIENGFSNNVKENDQINMDENITYKNPAEDDTNYETAEETDVCDGTYLFFDTTSSEYVENTEVENNKTIQKANETKNNYNHNYDGKDDKPEIEDVIDNNTAGSNEAFYLIKPTSIQHANEITEGDDETIKQRARDIQNCVVNDKDLCEATYLFIEATSRKYVETADNNRVEHDMPTQTANGSKNCTILDLEGQSKIGNYTRAKNEALTKKIDFIRRIKASLPTVTQWREMESRARELINEPTNVDVKKASVTEANINIANQLINNAKEPYSYVEVLEKVIANDSCLGINELDDIMQIQKGKNLINVQLDQFHGYIRKENGKIDCIVCKVTFLPDYKEIHRYELNHMNKVANVGDNGHCIRKVTSKSSHCIICNIEVKKKNATAHMLSSHHIHNKNKCTIAKTSTNENKIIMFETTKNLSEGLEDRDEKSQDISEIAFPYEKAQLGRVRCVICDTDIVKCYMKIHLRGSRHLNNVKQLPITSTSTDKTANTIDELGKIEESVEKDIHGDTHEKYSEYEVTYPFVLTSPLNVCCVICSVTMLYSSRMIQQHKSTLGHLEMVKKDTRMNTADPDKENQKCNKAGDINENCGKDINRDEANENMNKGSINPCRFTYPLNELSPREVCNRNIPKDVMEGQKKGFSHVKKCEPMQTVTDTDDMKSDSMDGAHEKKEITLKKKEEINIKENETNENISKDIVAPSKVTYPYEEVKNPKKVRCTICNRIMRNNLCDMENHKQGSGHLKNVTRLGKNKKKIEKKDHQIKNENLNGINKENGESSEVTYPYEETSQGILCTICTKFVPNSVHNMKQHKTGSEHLRNESKIEKEIIKSPVADAE